MSLLSKVFSATAILVIIGCASLPNGPSVMVLPGTGLSFDQFRNDDAVCQQFATFQVGGTSANQSGVDSGVTSAAVGTALGAAAGAAIGGGRGAAIGAGHGVVAGDVGRARGKGAGAGAADGEAGHAGDVAEAVVVDIEAFGRVGLAATGGDRGARGTEYQVVEGEAEGIQLVANQSRG